MMPPPLPEEALPEEEAPPRGHRQLKVALGLSGVVWFFGLVGLAIGLRQYVDDDVTWFFGLVLLSFVGPLFLLGQVIALVVALLARSRVRAYDPRLVRRAVTVPAVSSVLGVVGLILLVMAWRHWVSPLG